MKALYFDSHGTLENLKFGDQPEPRAEPGTVVVRVRACSLNHLDLWVLQGWPGLKLPLPHIGGADISGEIASLGEGVSEWKVGDRVALSPGYLKPGPADEFTERGEDSLSERYCIFGETRPGGFAEFVVAPAFTLSALPEGLDFPAAAASLLVGLTAWRMLKVQAQLNNGQSVLIVGAGGGLNSFSISLAKHLGAEVIALTSSPEKMLLAQQLGADHLINYQEHPRWDKEVKKLTNGRGVDVVVDNVGADTINNSMHAVRRGGKIVTVGNTSGPNLAIDNRYIFAKQISIIGSTMGSAADFEKVSKLIFGGALAARIDQVLPLKEGKEGFRRLSEGSQFGKIVLTP